jgi:hypothetical protein
MVVHHTDAVIKSTTQNAGLGDELYIAMGKYK